MSQIPNVIKIDQKARTHDVGEQAMVYAARMRLQNAVDQVDALDSIREIAGNLIGCEEVAVFKVDKKRSELWLYWSFGVDPNKHSILDVQGEPNLKLALRGKPVFRTRLPHQNLLNSDDPVNALIPIVVNSVVCAVIVLFRLFPHKPGIEAVDREICDVLSNCSSRAIEPHHSR
jgi:hypothetical protein